MTSGSDPIRVIHVDDDPDFAELTAGFLEQQDERLTVEIAESAADGLTQLSDENFDCVVSDYDMPNQDGIQFLETVREDYPELPFILYTGKGSEEIASEAISAGVTDYLQKESGTSQYSVLTNRIINAVTRRRTKRDLQASEERYRQLLEAAPVPILLYSENLEIIHSNEAAVEFLNADNREQLTGKHASEFTHPNTEDRVQSRLNRVASNREQLPAAELAITTVDGAEKYAIASSTPGTYEGEPVIQTVAYDITQKKEQAANYEAIFENTPDGIVIHDAENGSFVDMNTKYVEMFGYDSKDEFLSAGFEAIHPDNPPFTLDRAAKQVRKAATEGTHSLEWPGVRKDGSQFWAEVHLTPVELDSEQRILAAVRNITERKEREETLRETSRRLNLALEATETGVWEWNLETDEVVWSEPLEELLGVDPGTFEGTFDAFENYLHPDDAAKVDRAIEEAVQGDGTFTAEFRIRREDGDIIWVRGQGEYLADDGPDRLLGTTTDITEQKERERELRQEKAFTTAALESVVDFFWVIDLDGYVTRWSDTDGSVTGYTAEEAVELHSSTFHPDDHFPRIQEAIEEIKREGETQVEADLLTKDGERRHYLFTGIALTDERGEIHSLAGLGQDITDRKTREQELLEKTRRNERFQTLIGQTSDIIFVVDETGEISYINSAVEDILGYTPEDLIGQSGFDIIHPDDVERAQREFTQTIENPGYIGDVEFRAKHANGSIVDIEVRASNQLDNPNIDGVVVVARDITDRRRQQRRYEAIFNNSYTFVGLLEPDGSFVEVNDTALSFGDVAREAVIGELLWDTRWFQSSGEAQTTAKEGVKQARNGELFRDELRIEGSNREAVVDFTVRPVFDDRGDVIYLVSEARDITERKEREEALERYRRLVEVAGDPMYMLDAAGHIDYVNEKFVELSGYPETALIGEHIGKVMDPGDLAEAEELIRSLLSSGQRRGTFEMEAVTADGERIPAESHITLLFDNGEFNGSVGVMRVITERLERQHRLKRERDRFEEFANVLSHDLRNPLNVATGRLELLKEDCDSEDIEAIEQAQQRMQSLIEDMLSMANAGRTVGETEPVELARLTETCWQGVETASAEIVIETDLTIEADKSRLKQLLENLIRNAVEHGGNNVTITVGEHENGFFVEDDGPGIPPDERGEVFDPGYSSTEDGTGFGLNIVREIADAHGWRITVSESDDGGARFEFTEDEPH